MVVALLSRGNLSSFKKVFKNSILQQTGSCIPVACIVCLPVESEVGAAQRVDWLIEHFTAFCKGKNMSPAFPEHAFFYNGVYCHV